jgi:hypothetical protein
MTSPSNPSGMTSKQRADYGFARVRDSAYEAVMDLWRRRAGEGLTQVQLAADLGADEGWLSRNLKGPGNWTLRTVGRFVEALNGEIEISVHGLEDRLPNPPNFHAYVGYDALQTATTLDHPPDLSAPSKTSRKGLQAANLIS